MFEHKFEWRGKPWKWHDCSTKRSQKIDKKRKITCLSFHKVWSGFFEVRIRWLLPIRRHSQTGSAFRSGSVNLWIWTNQRGPCFMSSRARLSFYICFRIDPSIYLSEQQMLTLKPRYFSLKGLFKKILSFIYRWKFEKGKIFFLRKTSFT